MIEIKKKPICNLSLDDCYRLAKEYIITKHNDKILIGKVK